MKSIQLNCIFSVFLLGVLSLNAGKQKLAVREGPYCPGLKKTTTHAMFAFHGMTILSMITQVGMCAFSPECRVFDADYTTTKVFTGLTVFAMTSNFCINASNKCMEDKKGC